MWSTAYMRLFILKKACWYTVCLFFGEKTSCFRCGAACFSNKSTALRRNFLCRVSEKTKSKIVRKNLKAAKKGEDMRYFVRFWKLGWFFKASWRRYTIAVVLLIIVNVLEMFPPKLLGNAIDDMQAGTFIPRPACSAISVYFLRLAQLFIPCPIIGCISCLGERTWSKNSQIQADSAIC